MTTECIHTIVKVERDTLLLERVRQIEAALEARGRGVKLAGNQGAYTGPLVTL